MRSCRCVLLLALALSSRGASFAGAESSGALDRLSALPMISGDLPTAVVESSTARLAGLAVMLPTVSAESLGTLAGLREEFVKALEKVELPTLPAGSAGSGFALADRELPLPTLIAFGAGGVLLVALLVFAGALLKMSMESERKARRWRRRYAP